MPPQTAPADCRSAALERVCALAAAQAGVDPATITERTHLCNDLGFDSLDAVEFITAIEDEFSLSTTPADTAAVRTVGDAVDWLLRAKPNPADH